MFVLRVLVPVGALGAVLALLQGPVREALFPPPNACLMTFMVPSFREVPGGPPSPYRG